VSSAEPIVGHDHDHHEHDGQDHHDHGDGHEHEHDEPDHDHGGLIAKLRHAIAPHSHDAMQRTDTVMETSGRGTRTVAISFAALLITAALQGAVVLASGSVALLGDTLHNAADALTAVPLAIAFSVGRRPPSRRYTYGYGRAEDLAGIAIVLIIAASSAAAAAAAISRLIHPQTPTNLVLVGAAALIGFAGNELVAQYRIRVGRDIGSAALVADGLHARTDGLTSLAVLVGAGGVALGWPQADPVVGLIITAAILVVLRDAAREVYRRLMDAVDPQILGQVEVALRATPGVLDIGLVRLRWIGHELRAEAEIVVDHHLTVVAAHDVAEEAHHRLLHDIPRLGAAIVHPDPSADPESGVDHHDVTRHHR
jgi:cation diffusion facilitator family transporter